MDSCELATSEMNSHFPFESLMFHSRADELVGRLGFDLLMRRKLAHHHNVAGLHCWHRLFFEVGHKHVTIQCMIDDP